MANANINKVVYGNTTLIDLTNDTVTPGDVLNSKSFHDASGTLRSGSADISGKADKVSGATNGDLAGLNASGNLTDSGILASNVITKSNTTGLVKNDGTINTTITSAVSANTSAITAIKDGTSIDSFGDVETALNGKMDNYFINNGLHLYVDAETGITYLQADRTSSITQGSNDMPTSGAVYEALSDKISKSSTAGLIKNDGTVDTNNYLTDIPWASSSEVGGIRLGNTLAVTTPSNNTVDVVFASITEGADGVANSGDVYTALQSKASTAVVSKTANGLAPQLPNETTTTKFLRQDGTWQVPNYPSVPSAYTSNPNMDGTASAGSSTSWARGDHRHPTDTSRAANTSSFTQATTRANIASGETIPTILGKISKWFADLKDLAFIAKDGTSSTKYLRGDGTWQSFPAINNGTLTIQKNGSNVQTFTANQSSNATANIITDEWSSQAQVSNGSITFTGINDTNNNGYKLYINVDANSTEKNPTSEITAISGTGTANMSITFSTNADNGAYGKLRILK